MENDTGMDSAVRVVSSENLLDFDLPLGQNFCEVTSGELSMAKFWGLVSYRLTTIANIVFFGATGKCNELVACMTVSVVFEITRCVNRFGLPFF